jgi:hypothetical protein
MPEPIQKAASVGLVLLADHFANRLVELWNTSMWDDRSLAEFMGLTEPQYAAWVEGRYGEVLSER